MKDKIIAVRLPDDIYEIIKSLAIKKGLSISSLVRLILMEQLETQKKDRV